MTRIPRSLLVLASAAALAGGAAAWAQGGAVAAALDSGTVGEQFDGYLGFPRAPSPDLRAQVDAINIKRRQGYTEVAQARGVPIEAFATSIGCKTLAQLKTGRAYSVAPGVWAVKGAAPVALPPVCG